MMPRFILPKLLFQFNCRINQVSGQRNWHRRSGEFGDHGAYTLQFFIKFPRKSTESGTEKLTI